MDPYDKMMDQKKKRQKKIRISVAVGIFLLVCLILLSICVFGNYSLSVELKGEPVVSIRYGEDFTDPGAEAVLYGLFLPEEGIPVQIRVDGVLDPETVGTHQAVYRASFLFWKGEISRTLQVTDKVRPRILLHKDPASYYIPGGEYEEEGFLAVDNYDGDISEQVQVVRFHNRVIYRVKDSSGNTAEVVRKIVCYDPVSPDIHLLGEREIVLKLGQRYVEPGYEATDNLDGDLTDRVTVSGKVDVYHAGSYTLKYVVKDRYGNKAEQTRTVRIESTTSQEIIVPEGKVIYLTFDDGPGRYTRQLLDVLKKYDVKATFFVVKTKYLDLLKDIAAEGHSIGIHSVSHDYEEIYSSEEAYFKDLYEMRDIIESYTGICTTLVRFPGGSSNTVSKFNRGIMSRLTEQLGQMGFQYFDWNVNSGDAGDTTETEKVVEFVIAGVGEYDVAIVLQHDIKEYSVEAVEQIILWGLENGYRFLPLDSTSPNAHHQVRN